MTYNFVAFHLHCPRHCTEFGYSRLTLVQSVVCFQTTVYIDVMDYEYI